MQFPGFVKCFWSLNMLKKFCELFALNLERRRPSCRMFQTLKWQLGHFYLWAGISITKNKFGFTYMYVLRAYYTCLYTNVIISSGILDPKKPDRDGVVKTCFWLSSCVFYRWLSKGPQIYPLLNLWYVFQVIRILMHILVRTVYIAFPYNKIQICLFFYA